MLDDIKRTLPDVEKAVVVLSGGLDSTIVTYLAVSRYGAQNVSALSAYYGQKQGGAEIVQAEKTCKRLNIKHVKVDMKFLGDMVKGVSANMIGSGIEMPTIQEVLGEPQPVTYVPYRNMILNAIAFSFAEANDASVVFSGLQSHDCYGYWDTTPEFINAVNNVSILNRKHAIQICAPFVELAKVDEIRLGLELGVHFEETLTCYNPHLDTVGYVSCGKCPSCAERIMNFAKAGVADPIPYAVELDWNKLIEQYRE